MVDKKSGAAGADPAVKEDDSREGFVSIVSKRTGNAIASRRRMLIAGGVVLVLAVFGAIVWSLSRDSQAPTTADTDDRKVLLSDVAKANQDQNYSQEAELLQKYIDSNPPSEFAGDEIIRLGVAYLNAKNYDQAIKTYESAAEKYPESEFAALRGLAFVYMQRGDEAAANAENKAAGKDDYEKSLEYFRQTLELAKADESKRSGVPADESNIRYLEGQLR